LNKLTKNNILKFTKHY